MRAPVAIVCGSCGSDLSVDVHRPDCGGWRAAEIGPPPWQVLRLARDPVVQKAELVLEECNRRARRWMQVRGRPFP